MKKAVALLLVSICLLANGCSAMAEQALVMTSFYPIYLFALNVFDGVESVRVDCMTAPETGCLHDYQLLVGDMMKLSDAQALIICGAGMEAYLPDVQAQFPALAVIDCSEGIELLPAEEEDVHYHQHEEEEYNAHTWLDAQNAIQIVRTIAEQGSALFPAESEKIADNAAAYIARLSALDDTLKERLAPIKGQKIVTFHAAFPYFARAYGLDIAAVISEEHEESLSPARLRAVVEAVQAAGVPPLFTEPQYSAVAAYAVAAETGAAIYALDPLASGEVTLDAYEKGMLANADVLLQAFEQ